VTAAGAAVAAGIAGAALFAPGERDAVSFSRHVQPIFDAKCVACHPVAYEYLDLRPGRSHKELVGVVSPLAPAFERVLPGRPELSFLLTHVPDPSRENLLTPAERELIARWIGEGAKDN
jgi:hypothetical protein